MTASMHSHARGRKKKNGFLAGIKRITPFYLFSVLRRLSAQHHAKQIHLSTLMLINETDSEDKSYQLSTVYSKNHLCTHIVLLPFAI